MNIVINYVLGFVLASALAFIIYLMGSAMQLNSYAQMSILSGFVIYALWVALTEIGKRQPPNNPGL
jgi:predicted outer membrane lipoprotein